MKLLITLPLILFALLPVEPARAEGWECLPELGLSQSECDEAVSDYTAGYRDGRGGVPARVGQSFWYYIGHTDGSEAR